MKKTIFLLFSIIFLASCHVSSDQMNSVVVDEGFSIVDRSEITGKELDFIVYMIRADDENNGATTPSGTSIYWEIIVLRNGEMIQRIRHDWSQGAHLPPLASDLVLEIDVDFDGNNDLLVWRGRFGAQGSASYDLYIQYDGNFIHIPSFADIPNPRIDPENQVILGSWRNSSASHGYGIYHFINDELIKIEWLTTGWDTLHDAIIWHDQILVDGEWQTRELIVIDEIGSYADHVLEDCFDYWFGERWHQHFHLP